MNTYTVRANATTHIGTYNAIFPAFAAFMAARAAGTYVLVEMYDDEHRLVCMWKPDSEKALP
jgi:hypothetical protein